MPIINQNNNSIYYETYGEGFPLLLIAGLASDSSSWLNIVPELSKYFKVIIFDNRGCGRTANFKSPYTIQDMADDCKNLLSGLGIRKAHVLGHSMGGYIAQELALRHPKLVNKLILAGTASISSKRNNSLFQDLAKQLRTNKDYFAWIRRWTFWLFSKNTFNKPGFIDSFVKAAGSYKYPQQASGFEMQVKALTAFNAKNRVNRIKAKTLVLEGKEDILIAPPEAKELAKSIPHCKYAILKETAHCLHIENPKDFLKVVFHFLSTKTIRKHK
jgi:pimeloyl-ACP methyl ester carboxylesterase